MVGEYCQSFIALSGAQVFPPLSTKHERQSCCHMHSAIMTGEKHQMVCQSHISVSGAGIVQLLWVIHVLATGATLTMDTLLLTILVKSSF